MLMCAFVCVAAARTVSSRDDISLVPSLARVYRSSVQSAWTMNSFLIWEFFKVQNREPELIRNQSSESSNDWLNKAENRKWTGLRHHLASEAIGTIISILTITDYVTQWVLSTLLPALLYNGHIKSLALRMAVCSPTSFSRLKSTGWTHFCSWLSFFCKKHSSCNLLLLKWCSPLFNLLLSSPFYLESMDTPVRTRFYLSLLQKSDFLFIY